MVRIRSVAAAFSISIASVSAPVKADIIGGVFVTDPAWNAAATDAIGEPATVFRLFVAFDDGPLDRLQIIADQTEFVTSSGTLFYSPFGDRRPPLPAQFVIVPELEWDTYLAMGNLHQPSNVVIYGVVEFFENGIDTTGTEIGGAWFTQFLITVGESVARPPGGLDLNGATVVPEFLDPAYHYAFAGQFTILNYDGDFGSSGGDVLCGRFVNDPFSGVIVTGSASVSQPYAHINQFLVSDCGPDLSGDQVVDGADLSMLLSDWGDGGCLGDINGDGVTNAEDLANLLAGWGGCD